MYFEPCYKLIRQTKNLSAIKIMKNVWDDARLQAQAIDLNTESQLYEKGITSDEKSLGDYAPITIFYYKPLARAEGRDGRTDHITLKDTGDFYRSFKFNNENDGWSIDANTDKQGTDLSFVYGKILGLTDESINELMPEVKESFLKITRKELGI